MIQLYKVLSFIIMLIALLLSFIVIAGLLVALANPVLLLNVFILGAVVIYSFTSFSFLQKGLIRKQKVKSRLKDWIKVNAYVSFFLCSLFFLNAISILISSDVVLLKFIDEFLEQQPTMPKEITSALILSLLKGVSVFLLFTGVVGLIHIRTSLRLVKQYEYLFE